MLMNKLNGQQETNQLNEQHSAQSTQQTETHNLSEESSQTNKEVLTTPPSSKSTSPLQPPPTSSASSLQQTQASSQSFLNKSQTQQSLYANNINLINQQLLLNSLSKQQQQQVQMAAANSNASQTNQSLIGTSTGENYIQHYIKQEQSTLNLHPHSYLSNQSQLINFNNPQLSTNLNATASTGGYSMLAGNPYINLINNTQTSHQTSPTSANTASSNAGLIANFNLNGYNNANSAAAQAAILNLNPIHNQTHFSLNTGQVINTNPSGSTTTINNNSTTTINLNDEHQVYEYLHQLLDEKEKLKELFNEPLNILLPISARLLDEG